MNIRGSLSPIRVSNSTKATSYKSLCPQCAESGDAIPGEQFYGCPKGHGPFKAGDMAKGKELTKDTFEIIPQERVQEMKEAATTGLVPNVLSLSSHPKAEVEARTWTDGTAYQFTPDAGNEVPWAMLRELVKNDDFAFVGITSLRGTEYLVRLLCVGECLIVQSLIWPENLVEREAPSVPEIPAEMRDKAEELMKLVATPTNFDPDLHRSRTKAGHLKLMEELSQGMPLPARPTTPRIDPTQNFMEQLDAAIKAARGRGD
jgi:non-homologous end joining protein Ku